MSTEWTAVPADLDPRDRRRRTRASLLAAVLVGAALITACSGDTDDGVTRSAAAAVPECATSVAIGPFAVRSAEEGGCLQRTGLVWSASGPVLVGGVSLAPLGSTSRVSFDPLNARLSATGYEASGTLLGVKVVIASGDIDWSFQYRPDQNGALGTFMPASSDVVDLQLVSLLPGLRDAPSLPRDPVTGFADFSTVNEDDVALLAGRYPSLSTAEVALPLEAIGLVRVPRLTISLPTTVIQEIAGLNLGGAVWLQPDVRDDKFGIAVGGALELPEVLGGSTGSFAFFVPVNGSTTLDELLVEVPIIDYGAGRIEDLRLDYDDPTKTWTGGALVRLGPGADAIGLGGNVSIVDGRLSTIGVTVAGLPVDIGGVMSINRLGGELTIDPFRLTATGQFGIGPNVPSIGNVAVIDGNVSIDSSAITLGGVGTVGKITIRNSTMTGVRVADAQVSYLWKGAATITGRAQFFFDTGETWGLRGRVRGVATPTGVSLAGDATVHVGPFLTLGGAAAVGTKGWIACGRIAGTWFTDESRIGIAYDWGSASIVLRGNECNVAEYEIDPNAVLAGAASSGTGRGVMEAAFTRTATAGPQEVADTAVLELPAGQQMLTIEMDAVAGANVVAPDGTVIEVTTDDDAEVVADDPDDPRWIVLRPPGSTEAYVVVGSPDGGNWTVETPGEPVDEVTASVVAPESRPIDVASGESSAATPTPGRGDAGTATTDPPAPEAPTDAPTTAAPATEASTDTAPADTAPADTAPAAGAPTTAAPTAGAPTDTAPSAGDITGTDASTAPPSTGPDGDPTVGTEDSSDEGSSGTWILVIAVAVAVGGVGVGMLRRRRRSDPAE